MKNEIQAISRELISAAPTEAVRVVTERLPELTKKTEVFNRNNSQTTLNMMSLTMMTGQSPMRQIRQTLAEIEKRQFALAEAQVGHAELLEKIDKEPTNAVEEAKHRLHHFDLLKLEAKIGGSIKDIATLVSAYDRLVEKAGCADWNEQDFEQSEQRFHVRRGFELLYQNLVEVGRAKKATIEYLTQFGVHVQIAIAEVGGYIKHVDTRVANGERLTASDLEDFLDEMEEKYYHCVKEAALRMFGVEDIANPEFMTTWKK